MQLAEINAQIRSKVVECDALLDDKYEAFSRLSPRTVETALQTARSHYELLLAVRRLLYQLAVEHNGAEPEQLLEQANAPLDALIRLVQTQITALEAGDCSAARDAYDRERLETSSLEQKIRTFLRLAVEQHRGEFTRIVLQAKRVGFALLLAAMQACAMPQVTRAPVSVTPVELRASRVQEIRAVLGRYEYVAPARIVNLAYDYRYSRNGDHTLAYYVRLKPSGRVDKAREVAFTKEQMRKLRLSEQEIDAYLPLFMDTGIIIYKEEALYRSDFQGIQLHERIHLEWDFLPTPESNILYEAARELSETMRRSPVQYCTETVRKQLLNSDCLGAALEVDRSILEFYSYLAEGAFKPKLLEDLQTLFPRAYNIYTEMVRRAIARGQSPLTLH